MKKYGSSAKYSPVDRVVLWVDDEHCYRAPAGLSQAQWDAMTGKIIEADCPYATQQLANEILSNTVNMVYAPFTSENTFINPAAELGDGITTHGIYSILAAQTINFSNTSPSTIVAGKESEASKKIVDPTMRSFSHKLATITSELNVLPDSILAKVSGPYARDYDPTGTNYAVNNCCIYNNRYYKCTTAISAPAGAFDPTKWVETSSLEIAASEFAVDLDGLKLSVTNQGTSSIIQLKNNEITLSSQTINITGFVTFSGLANGTTTINGGCIRTGTIDADLIKTGSLDASYISLGNEFTLWGSNGSSKLTVGTFGAHVAGAASQYSQLSMQYMDSLSANGHGGIIFQNGGGSAAECEIGVAESGSSSYNAGISISAYDYGEASWEKYSIDMYARQLTIRSSYTRGTTNPKIEITPNGAYYTNKSGETTELGGGVCKFG